eukprot:SAG22_NODE_12002_length_460_cov_0.759003_1_plen_75_part_01
MGYQQADTFEIVDREPAATWMIFMPDRRFHMLWELTSVFLLMYITVVMPVRMGAHGMLCPCSARCLSVRDSNLGQ